MLFWFSCDLFPLSRRFRLLPSTHGSTYLTMKGRIRSLLQGDMCRHDASLRHEDCAQELAHQDEGTAKGLSINSSPRALVI